MKKKWLAVIAVLLSATCAFGFTACGKRGIDNGHRHVLSFIGKSEATCEKEGNSAYYICYGCGKLFEDEKGKDEIKDKKSVVIPKAHKMTHFEEEAATCTEDGTAEHYYCEICGKLFEDNAGDREIPDKESLVLKKGHRISGVGKKEPSCLADGNIEYYTCDLCDKWYWDESGNNEIEDKTSVIVSDRSHKLTFVEEKEATCSKDGNKAYYSCNVCNKWFTDSEGLDEIINKASVKTTKEHDFKDKICTVCGAHQGSKGLKYTEKSNYCTVSGIGEATDTEIFIADEYNGKRVTSIDDNAFENCKNITAVSIPDSINYIGGSAFRNCTGLKSVEIPEGVTYIAGYTFDNCTSLESVTLGKGVTYISDSAFKNCGKLKSIQLPDGVTFIGNNAFEECGSITSITLPDSVISIGSYAFAGCGSLTQAKVGKGITNISKGAFERCGSLTEINLPAGIRSIKESAFAGCGILTSINFSGTAAQWNAIEKSYKWNENTGNYTVYCTNGNVNKK